MAHQSTNGRASLSRRDQSLLSDAPALRDDSGVDLDSESPTSPSWHSRQGHERDSVLAKFGLASSRGLQRHDDSSNDDDEEPPTRNRMLRTGFQAINKRPSAVPNQSTDLHQYASSARDVVKPVLHEGAVASSKSAESNSQARSEEMEAQAMLIAELRRERDLLKQKTVDQEAMLAQEQAQNRKLLQEKATLADEMSQLRRRGLERDADTLRLQVKVGELSTSVKAQEMALARTRDGVDASALAGQHELFDAASKAIIDSKNVTIESKDALISELRESKSALREYVEEYKMQLHALRGQ